VLLLVQHGLRGRWLGRRGVVVLVVVLVVLVGITGRGDLVRRPPEQHLFESHHIESTDIHSRNHRREKAADLVEGGPTQTGKEEDVHEAGPACACAQPKKDVNGVPVSLGSHVRYCRTREEGREEQRGLAVVYV
jgi:hypothetical protein